MVPARNSIGGNVIAWRLRSIAPVAAPLLAHSAVGAWRRSIVSIVILFAIAVVASRWRRFSRTRPYCTLPAEHVCRETAQRLGLSFSAPHRWADRLLVSTSKSVRLLLRTGAGLSASAAKI